MHTLAVKRLGGGAEATVTGSALPYAKKVQIQIGHRGTRWVSHRR
jgi:hypothetical protein